MSNNTKIKFLNVTGKIYQVTDISFFHMTIEATETNLTAANVPDCELWDIEEFERYKVVAQQTKVPISRTKTSN